MPEQRRAYVREIRQQSPALALWWLDQMVATPQPFVERLTLFWHGHWATSIRKVRVPALMLTQNETLRTHAAGDFRAMARAMVQDPALLVWLDAGRNKRESPNENLSRELMELFTLGRGFYSEEDVREGARALTGWRTSRANGDVRFVARQHDPGPHTILGVTASYDSESLVDLLVGQPQSARFVVERLWARFGSPEMPDALRDDLIAAYESQRNIATTMSVPLRSPEFLAAPGALVKTPIEWAVGAMRVLGIRPSTLKQKEQTQALFALAGMGQVPFAPPSVGGWPSGSAWLGTAATQARLWLAAFLAARPTGVPATGPQPFPLDGRLAERVARASGAHRLDRPVAGRDRCRSAARCIRRVGAAAAHGRRDVRGSGRPARTAVGADGHDRLGSRRTVRRVTGRASDAGGGRAGSRGPASPPVSATAGHRQRRRAGRQRPGRG